MMARVRGMRRRTRLPWPRTLLDLDAAADPLDVVSHHVHADAPPRDVGDLSAVENPGRKIRLMSSVSLMPLGLLGGEQPALDGPAAHAIDGRCPAPSSLISMSTWPPSW